MFIDLNGEWQFKCGDNELTAIIPSSNYQTLLENGKILDPFLLDNEFKEKNIGNLDCTYKKTFVASKELLDEDKIFLFLEQIDTIASLYLNNKKIYDFKDSFIEYKIDIKDSLILGDNEIRIEFKSPVKYVEEKYKEKKTTKNSNGQDGVSYIRKPACHFGWDWGPVIPISGITKNVYIKTFNEAHILDFNVVQFHKNKRVELGLNIEVNGSNKKGLKCIFKLVSPLGEEEILEAPILNSTYKGRMIVLNPMLWWTRELSMKETQPLYNISATLYLNDEEIDKKEYRIGLREIKLDTSKDEHGQNFAFILNGVKLFIKGANFIPPDSLINRYKKEDYDKLIDAVLFSNMNMIRIWGGGYIGDKYLYDKCDEKGILIWQDFPYACMGYPFFIDEFKTQCVKEAKEILKSIRYHASLALLCGNNEIEQMSLAWITNKNFIKSNKEFFYKDLKNIAYQFAQSTPYIEGTPKGNKYLKGVNSDKILDTHIWAVWHGLKDISYYSKRNTRFCSEFGFESFPSIKTIKAYNGDEKLDFSSKYISSHQKCASGNDKMIYYIASRFNLPSTFEEYVYLSQVMQEECIRYGVENWRCQKGKCNGALYWQLNDCWPTSSWSSIDYYNRYKALQYGAKKFFNPLCISIKNTKNGVTVYAFNDLISSKKVDAYISIYNLQGKKLDSKKASLIVSTKKAEKIFSIDIEELIALDKNLDLIINAKLAENGKLISESTILLKKEKDITLPNPEIEKQVSIVDGKIKITIKNKAYAHFVYVENKALDTNLSDNYFSLLPNSEKVIYQDIKDGYTLNEEDIKIFSAYNLTKKGNKVSDNLSRLKVILKPINFVNYLFNR